MESAARKSPRSRGRRLGIGLALAVVLYLAVGFLLVPILVKSQAVSILAERTGITPKLERVRFDPLRLRLRLEGFDLREPDAAIPLVAFDALALDLRLLGFLRADLALDGLYLVGPRVSAVFDEAGQLGLTPLLESLAGEASSDSPDPEATEPLVVDIDVIEIENGAFLFRDLALDEPFEVLVSPLNLTMRELSTRPGVTAPYALDLQIGTATRLHWEGDLGLDPLQSVGEVVLADLDLRMPWQYLSRQLRFEIRSGRLGLSADYEVSLAEGFDLRVRDASMRIADLSLIDPGRAKDASVDEGDAEEGDSEVLMLPALELDGIELVAGGTGLSSITVAEVKSVGGRMATRIEEDGQLRLVHLLEPAGEPDEEDVAEDDAAYSASAARAPAIRIDRISALDWTIDFEDLSTPRPVGVRVAPIDLEVQGFDTKPGSELTVRLDASLPEAGRIVVTGPIQRTPLEARLEMVLTDLELHELDPYVARWARVELPAGTVSANLALSVADRGGDELEVEGKGRLEVANLEVRDLAEAREVLRWKTLRLEGLALDSRRLHIEEIGLDGAIAWMELDAEGRMNLAKLIVEAPPAPPEEVMRVASRRSLEIRRVRLEDLGARITDLSVAPSFELHLDGLTGTIDGLSSEESTRAKVALEARINQTAPLEIKGEVNPLSARLFADLSVQLDGFSMPSLAPYVGRYVGRGIDRGRLDVRLDYELSGGTLDAGNHFLLERFSFGESVESPQATSLPVPLAMGLMRDRKGDIEIDLPIRGRLDDPSFSVASLLTKSFTNLVTRIVSAPFAVLGGVVGASAEDLSRVDFTPGSGLLSEEEKLEVERLAQLLAERPELRIEIRGRADPAVDGAANPSAGQSADTEPWRGLARARASAVRNALLGIEGMTSDRVFLSEVELGAVAIQGVIPTELSLSAR